MNSMQQAKNDQLTVNKSIITGVYKLLSFIIRNEDGIEKKWRGDDCTGQLIYTNDGYMSVNINSLASLDGTAEKQLSHILSYSGAYTIEGAYINHIVNNASSNERVGEVMKREFVWNDGILQLIGRGSFGTAILRWEKI